MSDQSSGYYTGAGEWRPLDDVCQSQGHDWTLVDEDGTDIWICRDCGLEATA